MPQCHFHATNYLEDFSTLHCINKSRLGNVNCQNSLDSTMDVACNMWRMWKCSPRIGIKCQIGRRAVQFFFAETRNTSWDGKIAICGLRGGRHHQCQIHFYKVTKPLFFCFWDNKEEVTCYAFSCLNGLNFGSVLSKFCWTTTNYSKLVDNSAGSTSDLSGNWIKDGSNLWNRIQHLLLVWYGHQHSQCLLCEGWNLQVCWESNLHSGKRNKFWSSNLLQVSSSFNNLNLLKNYLKVIANVSGSSFRSCRNQCFQHLDRTAFSEDHVWIVAKNLCPLKNLCWFNKKIVTIK